MVAPDAATCAACLAELFDPADRRYRYPFINCTDCGPRFSIVLDVPYDRARTTMSAFSMCAPCRSEYEDPADRRYHAQPNACARCGPAVRLVSASGGHDLGVDGAAADAVALAAAALRDGAILAIKGIGGYHLACRADDDAVVSRLRRSKVRAEKPFALMVAHERAARAIVHLDDAEAALLGSPAAPIVLARRIPGSAIAPAAAPGCIELGVMLAYTPLHHLLLADLDGVPLVMTSGNRSDEPIAFRDDDAFRRLGPLVDLFLTHDRDIRTRVEDSLARVVTVAGERRTMLLRRSRGFVPGSLDLPVAPPRPTLGCGAELKATFAVAEGRTAWIGPHIGDLREYEALRAYRDGLAHVTRLFGVDPGVAAHDLHPDYLSTGEATARAGTSLGVQHHHAHMAACLAEHGVAERAVGAIFDGAGYGPDGTVWGGELLVGDAGSFRRVGHLWPVRLPGGDAAARAPWRMACAWLLEAGGEVPELPPRLKGVVHPAAWSAVARMAAAGLRSPPTSSVGRLFDAVAALAGVRAEASYEGQAAIELEAAISEAPGDAPPYPLPLVEAAGGIVLDARPTVLAAARDAAAGASAGLVSARFHAALGAATAEACVLAARAHGLSRVVLSGGVFQNVHLLEAVAAALSHAGLRVLVPSAVPPNDGGIAFGQVAVAAARGEETRVAAPLPNPARAT
jgi:hydrogenase maturation protein HypF